MVKSVGKWWVPSDEPTVENMQLEIDELYQEIDDLEKEVVDLEKEVDDKQRMIDNKQRMIYEQQKLINNLKEQVSVHQKHRDSQLMVFPVMQQLLNLLTKLLARRPAESLKTKEVSPVTNQPTEGKSTDLLTDASISSKAEPAVEAGSSSE